MVYGVPQEAMELFDSDDEEGVASAGKERRANCNVSAEDSTIESIDLCERAVIKSRYWSPASLPHQSSRCRATTSSIICRTIQSPPLKGEIVLCEKSSSVVAKEQSPKPSRFYRLHSDENELLQEGPTFSNSRSAAKTPSTTGAVTKCSSVTKASTISLDLDAGAKNARTPPKKSIAITPGGARIHVVNPYRATSTTSQQ